jgi:hypothetical protein
MFEIRFCDNGAGSRSGKNLPLDVLQLDDALQKRCFITALVIPN